MKIRVYLFVILFFTIFTTKAATFYSRGGGGNWNAAGTWSTASCGGASSGTTPGAGDDVVICNGHPVTVTASTLCNTLTVNASATLTINAGVVLNVSTGFVSFSTNDGTINGSGTLTITGSGNLTLHTFTNNGTVSVTTFNVTASAGAWTFAFAQATNNGTFTNTNMYINEVTGGFASFATSTFTNNSTVNISSILDETSGAGDFTNAANSTLNFGGSSIDLSGTFTANTSGNTVNYNLSTGNQTVLTPSGSTYHHLTLSSSGAGADRTKTTGAALTVNGNVTVSDRSVLSLGGNMSVAGNWVNSSTAADPLTQGTTTVTFNGNAAQSISNTGDANGTVFYNVTVNNTYTPTAGTPYNIELSGSTNVTAQNALTLTAGIVNLNGNMMSLGTSPGTTGTLTVAANTYLYGGNFRRWFSNSAVFAVGAASGLFPLGNPWSTTYAYTYRPYWVGATLTGAGRGHITVRHYYTVPSWHTAVTPFADASWGNNVVAISNSYWAVSSSVTLSGNASIRFGGENMGTNTTTDLNATNATAAVGTHAAASGPPYYVNRTGLTMAQVGQKNAGGGDLSPLATVNWYIGTKNKGVSPLPITLLSFTATPDNDAVNLKWSTATEINNDYFTIERSKDALTFTPILTQKGAGNSNAVLNYSDVDPSPLNGISYYRLKQTDFNGKFSYSNIVSVNFDVDFSMSINPNPTNTIDGNILISGKENEFIEIQIINVLGEVIYAKTIQLNKSQSYTLPLSQLSGIAHGTYFVKATSDNTSLTMKFIIE